MANSVRKIELFTEGDPLSWKAILLIRHFSVPNCEISVLDIREHAASLRAVGLGVRSIPAVAIDGKYVEVDIAQLERDIVYAVRALKDMDSWRLNLEVAKDQLRTALDRKKGRTTPDH